MTHRLTICLALFAFASACGGVKEEDPCLAANPDEALNCLGVPPDDSDRVDGTGDALPPDYAPLGPTQAVGVSSEFLLLGMQVAPPVPAGEPVPLQNRGAILEFSDDATGVVGPGVVDLIAEGTIWEQDSTTIPTGNGGSSSGSRTTRAVAATDFEGDGMEELVVVYLDFDDVANEGVVFAEFVGGVPSVVGTFPGAADVVATSGDFNGDGLVELAVGISGADSASVFVVEKDAAGSLVANEASTKSFSASLSPSQISLELASGNIDRDAGDELVVVVNEFGSRTLGQTSFSIIDDETAGFADLLTDGEIRARDNGTHTAVVGDVAIGDVDADGKGEILFAGVVETHDQGCTPYRFVYLALDDGGDAEEKFAPIGERSEMVRYTESSGCSNVSTRLPVRHAFINALDINNDGVDEVQVNLKVFADFRAGSFVEAFAIDDSVFGGPDGRGGGSVSTSTAAMETADVNGDGREDIVVFAQHTDAVFVWGLDGPAPESAVFREMTSISTANYNSQSRVFPIIAAVNVDTDGAIFKYSEAEYRFVFTEPIVMAAVAAAPCIEGIGQNTEACVTSYGVSTSESGGVDASISVSASAFVSVEAKDPFFGIGIEGKETFTASASFSASASYSLSETFEYSTGPLEDTVIFTTLPIDQYSYTVVAHPDPTMVGEIVTINLPRKPITLQVEREFYNQSVAPGSLLIDASVFKHTVGDVASYPTEAEASAAVAGGEGLKASSAVTVGQGGGQTTTELVFSEEVGYRAGAEISYEKEVAVTGGGVGVGGSIGGTAGAGLSWGTSTSTIYRGSIGSISSSGFSENLYSAGLFTYIHNRGNSTAQQFEVITYWVEQ